MFEYICIKTYQANYMVYLCMLAHFAFHLRVPRDYRLPPCVFISCIVTKKQQSFDLNVFSFNLINKNPFYVINLKYFKF